MNARGRQSTDKSSPVTAIGDGAVQVPAYQLPLSRYMRKEAKLADARGRATDACRYLAGERPDLDQPSKIDNTEAYTYKSVDAADLRLHVFSPKNLQATDKRPAIVFF